MSKLDKFLTIQYKTSDFERRLIALSIKSNIKNKDYDKLSGILELGFNKLNRTRHYKSILFDGFNVLASHYKTQGNLVLAFNALQKARELYPFKLDAIQKQIATLDQFIENIDGPITENDIKLLMHLCNNFLDFYSKKKFSRKVSSLLSPVYKKVNALYEKIKLDVESPITAGAEKMVMNLYSDLTDEEREKRIGVIIRKTIDDMLKDEYLKQKRKNIKIKNPS